ncbi:MAG TPA: cyclic nucleotide-binding domain-containing protein [Spirillospora sp.]|nr:cyclic nucleotide-binding domain-containing protein [Spirillospora sp.]
MGVLTGEELAREPFLHGMRRADLTRLATAGRRVTIPAAHRICAEGRPAEHFWIIDAGTVTVDLRLPDRRAIIESLGPGSVLGWSWLFQPRRWSYGAVTDTPVDAIEFDGRLVRTLCAVDTSLGYELTRRFAELVVERLHATRVGLLEPVTASHGAHAPQGRHAKNPGRSAPCASTADARP